MGEQGIHSDLTPPMIHLHDGSDREREVREAIEGGILTIDLLSMFFGHQTVLELLSMRRDEDLVLQVINPSKPVIQKHLHGPKEVIGKNYLYRLIKP